MLTCATNRCRSHWILEDMLRRTPLLPYLLQMEQLVAEKGGPAGEPRSGAKAFPKSYRDPPGHADAQKKPRGISLASGAGMFARSLHYAEQKRRDHLGGACLCGPHLACLAGSRLQRRRRALISCPIFCTCCWSYAVARCHQIAAFHHFSWPSEDQMFLSQHLWSLRGTVCCNCQGQQRAAAAAADALTGRFCNGMAAPHQGRRLLPAAAATTVGPLRTSRMGCLVSTTCRLRTCSLPTARRRRRRLWRQKQQARGLRGRCRRGRSRELRGTPRRSTLPPSPGQRKVTDRSSRGISFLMPWPPCRVQVPA